MQQCVTPRHRHHTESKEQKKNKIATSVLVFPTNTNTHQRHVLAAGARRPAAPRQHVSVVRCHQARLLHKPKHSGNVRHRQGWLAGLCQRIGGMAAHGGDVHIHKAASQRRRRGVELEKGNPIVPCHGCTHGEGVPDRGRRHVLLGMGGGVGWRGGA